jgi:hypothetical protein
VSPVRYEPCFYTTEDDILHSRRSDNLKFIICLFASSNYPFETLAVNCIGFHCSVLLP